MGVEKTDSDKVGVMEFISPLCASIHGVGFFLVVVKGKMSRPKLQTYIEGILHCTRCLQEDKGCVAS